MTELDEYIRNDLLPRLRNLLANANNVDWHGGNVYDTGNFRVSFKAMERELWQVCERIWDEENPK